MILKKGFDIFKEVDPTITTIVLKQGLIEDKLLGVMV